MFTSRASLASSSSAMIVTSEFEAQQIAAVNRGPRQF
jgi:hypothetical protein